MLQRITGGCAGKSLPAHICLFDFRRYQKLLSTPSRRSVDPIALSARFGVERPPAGANVLKEDRSMNMELSRRHFLVGAGAGLAGTTLGALGFSDIEAAHAAAIRPYKLAQTKEARTICPYC